MDALKSLVSSLVLTMLLLLPLPVQAHADDWLFSAGYSWLSGFYEIRSAYRQNARDAGRGDDIYPLSIGVFFQAHRRITDRLRAGAGAGPFMLLIDDANHVQIPASLSAKFLFFPDAAYSPYVRAGLSWHYASGDYVSKSRPGVLAGAGMELLRKKRLRLGLEAAYDGARVDIERPYPEDARTIRPGALTLSVFALF